MGSALYIESQHAILRYCNYDTRRILRLLSTRYRALMFAHMNAPYHLAPRTYYPKIGIIEFGRLIVDAQILAEQHQRYGNGILPRIHTTGMISQRCINLPLDIFELCITSLAYSLVRDREWAVDNLIDCYMWVPALISDAKYPRSAIMYRFYIGIIRAYPAGISAVLHELYADYIAPAHLRDLAVQHSRGELPPGKYMTIYPIAY